MKLTVLTDNNTCIDQYYCGEPAVSYYIEDAGTRILLDAGYSDVFLKNAAAMNINLSGLDLAVFSHGHNDHTGGLPHLLSLARTSPLKIVAHPDTFLPKTEHGISIGSPLSAETLADTCALTLTREPLKLSPHLTYLGEIPQTTSFERRELIGEQKKNGLTAPDLVLDDSALVYEKNDELYIITGCSHSGICNIMEYAKKVCKKENIRGVIGGFHLFDVNTQLEQTIRYFRDHQIRDLYPCHCVSFVAKAAIHSVLPVQEVGVGKVLHL